MATRKWLPYFYYINPSFLFLKIHRLIKPISPQTTPKRRRNTTSIPAKKS